ncbi:Rpa49 subunit specific to nuclear RNA polymerase I [Coprinopsis marcescibilis]|uniref:Rpa49 subunit specific to nuclear RNA polymerase I n=1 Tax=Coprinopsis marcescibilis TaxID=230819 RepID=A0A5C3KW58_COPMA|nr:Rpa49 subunit specific to nuclear RNA polymerase I [Coprinopsis marcescibilis]
MSAVKSGSKKRKRDPTPDTAGLTFQLSSSKPSQGGPFIGKSSQNQSCVTLNKFIVSYPAVQAPTGTTFDCYAKKKSKTQTNNSGDADQEDPSDIMLVGETEAVEFVTNEAETSRVAEGGCHYLVAVHNRKTGQVSILSRPKIPHILGHTVKALKSVTPLAAPSKTQYLEAKNALGETFGTKKAKAAIRAQERNHVDIGAMEGVMNYVMDSIDKGAEGLMTDEQAKVSTDNNRLIPPFSATANMPDDIYPLHSIIPEVEWKALSVSAFDSTQNENERLALLPFRYSNWIKEHINALGNSSSSKSNKKTLKILLYISGMLAFRQASSRKEISKDQIQEKLSSLPSIVADSLLSRFTEVPRGSTTYQATSTTKTNLLTHMFALCLKVDKFATNTELLAADLSMKTAEVNQLFRSLGCKIVKLTERERTKLGLPDSVADQKRAVLNVPVEFPKPKRRRAN